MSGQGEKDVVLLQYSKGYWIGIDGDTTLQIPDVLLKQEVREWLRENGYSTVITMAEGGARAQAYRVCRNPAYWRLVTDPRILRTPAPEQPTKESEQDSFVLCLHWSGFPSPDRSFVREGCMSLTYRLMHPSFSLAQSTAPLRIEKRFSNTVHFAFVNAA